MADTVVVTPWHDPKQLTSFLKAWDISSVPSFLLLQQDKHREGCAATKNRGILNAIGKEASTIIILDDDCFPSKEATNLQQLMELHLEALKPQPVELFQAVTTPQSRGTPYFNKTVPLEVAASMGFWLNVGDYDAPSQLALTATHPMQFSRTTIFGKFFALSGMNIAFRATWLPYCQFVNIPRFDDIWAGFIWQKRAYELGCCFNLNGPLVTHSRQSNVWDNLRDEAKHLETNETIWSFIRGYGTTDYNTILEATLNYANNKS